jgi:hypothetical protein
MEGCPGLGFEPHSSSSAAQPWFFYAHQALNRAKNAFTGVRSQPKKAKKKG